MDKVTVRCPIAPCWFNKLGICISDREVLLVEPKSKEDSPFPAFVCSSFTVNDWSRNCYEEGSY